MMIEFMAEPMNEKYFRMFLKIQPTARGSQFDLKV